MARPDEYVNAVREANRAIWDGINTLITLQREYNALDYGNTLGTVAGYTATQVGAVVFDTANAFGTVLASGYATNMAKLL